MNELNASDLRPANLERSYDAAHNRALQYCDSLRVVHVMESRLEDMKQANEDRGERSTVPSSQSAPQTRQSQPKTKPEGDKDSGGGSSRRESPGNPSFIVVAEDKGDDSLWTRNSLLAAVWQLSFAGGRG